MTVIAVAHMLLMLVDEQTRTWCFYQSFVTHILTRLDGRRSWFLLYVIQVITP